MVPGLVVPNPERCGRSKAPDQHGWMELRQGGGRRREEEEEEEGGGCLRGHSC